MTKDQLSGVIEAVEATDLDYYDKSEAQSKFVETYSIKYLKTNYLCKLSFQTNSAMNFPYYDFIMISPKKGLFSVEVKLDKHPSNNLAIEYIQSGSPSGISITKADYYFIFKLKNRTMYYLASGEIKAYIKENNLTGVPTTKDGRIVSWCYLMPMTAFKELK